MPSGLIPDEGLSFPLQFWLQSAISGVFNWTMILWVNDYTPDHTTVLANLTEATWTGYTRVTLNRSQWSNPNVHSSCAQSQWGDTYYTWFVSGTEVQTNFGWAMVDYGVNQIRFVQRFDDSDINPIQIGGQFALWPTITMTSAPCPGSMAISLRGTPKNRKRKINA